ncbi:MAG TPA: GlsB/YeaQ/YmgE family stress response membrane protein [Candidatus Acidoferrales bacterium]|nr:GlsB/YeaQ/YmgE family stress response membrane protein [Candidatus Acidoferrales bacterium]
MFYLVWVVLLGISAGWIAGKIMKGSGFGLLGNLIVGILGSLLGSFIFGLIGMSAYGLPARLIMAVVGSVILLWLLRFIKKS